MGNSKIIIAVVVLIIVVKLVAVHLYLKKKMDEPENIAKDEVKEESKDNDD